MDSLSWKQIGCIIGAGLIGLYALNGPDLTPTVPTTEPETTFATFGPAGETVMRPGITTAEAKAALGGTDYHGAYAVAPDGRSGVWTDAHNLDIARRHALSACGADCRIVADRLPRHRRASQHDTDLSVTLLRALGSNVTGGGLAMARGGASAWGMARRSGRFARAEAGRDAMAGRKSATGSCCPFVRRNVTRPTAYAA